MRRQRPKRAEVARRGMRRRQGRRKRQRRWRRDAAGVGVDAGVAVTVAAEGGEDVRETADDVNGDGDVVVGVDGEGQTW